MADAPPDRGMPGRRGPSSRCTFPSTHWPSAIGTTAFGFTGYQLVLSGRTGNRRRSAAAVAWLTSAFHDTDVVVVENAVASAWKGRALRGKVAVDTRMDLWRLWRTPTSASIWRRGSTSPESASRRCDSGRPSWSRDLGGGRCACNGQGRSDFCRPGGAARGCGTAADPSARSVASRRGWHYADANYGTPAEFTTSLRAVLSSARP